MADGVELVQRSQDRAQQVENLGHFQLSVRRLAIVADAYVAVSLAIDTTFVSPIRADGIAGVHAAHRDGVAPEEAHKTEYRKYFRCRILGREPLLS